MANDVAPRLTVIISQSKTRDGRSVDTEESLVAHLMMTPGLDATLIGSLEAIQPDSTDFLCLSSFQHSFAFISWLDESEVAQHWSRLELAGSVARLGATREVERKPRIYYLPLTHATRVEDVLQQLGQLQNERSVQTVNIMLGTPVPGMNRTPRKPTIRDGTEVSGEVASLPVIQPVGLSATRNATSIDAVAPQQPVVASKATPLSISQRPNNGDISDDLDHSDDDEEWEELDRLVDDLDAFKF